MCLFLLCVRLFDSFSGIHHSQGKILFSFYMYLVWLEWIRHKQVFYQKRGKKVIFCLSFYWLFATTLIFGIIIGQETILKK